MASLLLPSIFLRRAGVASLLAKAPRRAAVQHAVQASLTALITHNARRSGSSAQLSSVRLPPGSMTAALIRGAAHAKQRFAFAALSTSARVAAHGPAAAGSSSSAATAAGSRLPATTSSEATAAAIVEAPPQPSSASARDAGGAPVGAPTAGFSLNPVAWWSANKERLKGLAKQYGWFVFATYFGVYLVTLGAIFLLVKAGVVAGPSPASVNSFLTTNFIKRMLLGDCPIAVPLEFVDFATAWVITKTTEPVRLVVTIAIVPALARRMPGVAAIFGVKAAVDAARP